MQVFIPGKLRIISLTGIQLQEKCEEIKTPEKEEKKEEEEEEDPWAGLEYTVDLETGE